MTTVADDRSVPAADSTHCLQVFEYLGKERVKKMDACTVLYVVRVTGDRSLCCWGVEETLLGIVFQR